MKYRYYNLKDKWDKQSYNIIFNNNLVEDKKPIKKEVQFVNLKIPEKDEKFENKEFEIDEL